LIWAYGMLYSELKEQSDRHQGLDICFVCKNTLIFHSHTLHGRSSSITSVDLSFCQIPPVPPRTHLIDTGFHIRPMTSSSPTLICCPGAHTVARHALLVAERHLPPLMTMFPASSVSSVQADMAAGQSSRSGPGFYSSIGGRPVLCCPLTYFGASKGLWSPFARLL
jgi:hypothetical protein